ncbi:hypothetical protein SAMN06265371_1022 [Lutibacter agarilyticus]|uniref:Uncharacterized protein n=1 Tax=Lutibacter agarilyticus TaxID=1109740 RepID=A0A238VRW2_9FLAO|nr:hypothetical protein [Lutibacter agarilyticus]SNR36988.1 hypothetical protein SAMN06265371_1022 [Lutibacter agarilyticus]
MQTKSDSLSLTIEYFKILLSLVHETFMQKHALKKLPKTFQLYGYGVYNEDKPNLKSDFENIGDDFVNGKYLYDKSREVFKDKQIIKLNEYYKSVLLLYIGYENFEDFLKEHPLSELEIEKQLSLNGKIKQNETHYYLNYYFGEDDVIIKGRTVIFNNWKKIQHTFLYPLEDGSFKEHYSNGNVILKGDTLCINSKTLSGEKYIDGASEIYYIGHKSPSSIKYLVGTYCTFDIYTNTVAGRSILEKCENKEEMEEKSKDPNIPAYIALEVRNKRIINTSTIPKNSLELSKLSPFSSIYGKIPGIYEITFNFKNDFSEVLKFEIVGTNYKINTLTENVYIEKDRIELLNKGSILNFRFNFSGIIALERVNIYFKTYYLKDGREIQKGVFSGIDNENRLVNGTLTLKYSTC